LRPDAGLAGGRRFATRVSGVPPGAMAAILAGYDDAGVLDGRRLVVGLRLCDGPTCQGTLGGYTLP
jgi:hypothetical protein